MLSITIVEGEKKEFENKISRLEAQKSVTNRQAEELRDRVGDLETRNNSLETQLKTTNERQLDITPFREQALLASFSSLSRPTVQQQHNTNKKPKYIVPIE